MIKYCLDCWNENKKLLEDRLRSDRYLNECSYEYLVKLVVDYILNPNRVIKWDSEKIRVINDGDYQGTLLFLVPKNTYQPAEYEYLLTYVNYGSCSGCDTLLSIQGCRNELPTDEQVKDFMTLCKDILTNMIRPYNYDWRYSEDFDYVLWNSEDDTCRGQRNG